jgi:hypothetical protein
MAHTIETHILQTRCDETTFLYPGIFNLDVLGE